MTGSTVFKLALREVTHLKRLASFPVHWCCLSFAQHRQVHNLLIRFSRFFPFFGSQEKLDRGKSIELSRNYIQISDGTGSKQGRLLENRRGLFSL
jgi:hypothetical protein